MDHRDLQTGMKQNLFQKSQDLNRFGKQCEICFLEVINTIYLINISIIISFLFEGKYYKKSIKEINVILKQEYGDITIMKTFVGQPDIVMLFNPQDFEQVNTLI